ncbi:MAG: 4Fe-4S binding protein [Actinobacteria bacterium]|nr:4Fe-4S binding protein [Actinomycetota bacterium]
MRVRRWVQAAGLILANPWFAYLSTRTIYQGDLKGVCFPGFNCYACPFALFSCPIGSLQHGIGLASPRKGTGNGITWFAWSGLSSSLMIILYVVGFIGIIGILSGRLVCGWFCPFGFFQDLMFKIPTPKLRMPGWMRYGKYGALVVLVIIIPFFSGRQSFCRLCPAGTLEGLIPLKLIPPGAALPQAGWFIWLKIAILIAFLIWMIVTSRPFCRAACPLGACYGLLNKVSVYHLEVDSSACTACGKCRKVCPVDIDIYLDPNSPECIRCLECIKACPENAISSGFRAKGRSRDTVLDSVEKPGQQ